MTEVLRIVSGSANPGLAGAVANHLGVESDGCDIARYPDGELRPTIENVCGADVYVVQPTAPPVSEHIVELLLLLDACRRSRAARVTAVVPYFGFARQDRRTASGQALGSAVVANAIADAGADRLVVVDPMIAPGRDAQRIASLIAVSNRSTVPGSNSCVALDELPVGSAGDCTPAGWWPPAARDQPLVIATVALGWFRASWARSRRG